MIEIICTVLTLLLTVGLPAYLKYRKSGKIIDALQDTVDGTVAHLAKRGQLEDAKQVQGIARTALTLAGAGVKVLNDRRLKANRAKRKTDGGLDLSAAMAEAERHKAAIEGPPKP